MTRRLGTLAAVPRSREGAALGYALAAVAAWSTVATGFKLGLRILEPIQLLFLGSVISAVLFALLATAGGHWRPASRRGAAGTMPWLVQAAAFGLLNPTLYYLVLFEAYDRLPAQIAQPLNYTWAITMALLAVPVLGQRLTRNTLAGICIGYLGVLVLLSRGSLFSWSDLDWLGVTLALGSTVLWAGYWLANARSTLPPLTLMAWSFLLASPVLALLCYLGPGLPPLTPATLGYGAWVGLIEMGFTFLLWQRALRLSDHAARIGQLIFLSPFLSLVLIAAVLGESIYPTSIVGLAIIVVGLWVSRRDAP
jgi:drug/metabolite transporter (DMT)-like permease